MSVGTGTRFSTVRLYAEAKEKTDKTKELKTLKGAKPLPASES